MNESPFFSIIMPTYNAEKYIMDAISSVLQQTFDDFELIVCEDHSTDQTPLLLYKFCDPRIKVIRNLNRGVSYARNTGLETCSGKYIVFFDSDDLLKSDFLSTAYSFLCKNHGAFLITGHKSFVNELTNFSNIVSYLTLENFLEDIDVYLKKYKLGTVWAKVFHGETIRKNKISFDARYSFGEDTLFVLDYLSYVSNLIIIDKPYYFYRHVNNQSLSKTHWDYYKEIQYLVLDKLIKLLCNFNIRNKDIIIRHRQELIETRCHGYE